MGFLEHLGRYFLLMLSAFSKPDKFKIFAKKVVEEIDLIGIGSLPIVAILSCFMGAVMLIQAAYNFVNPLLPMYVEGVATRDTMILEFSPTSNVHVQTNASPNNHRMTGAIVWDLKPLPRLFQWCGWVY